MSIDIQESFPNHQLGQRLDDLCIGKIEVTTDEHKSEFITPIDL